jgi:hypothetical protein
MSGAAVNASARLTVVVALAKKPVFLLAPQRTRRVRASATCATRGHRRHYEEEGDPGGSPSSLLLAQPSSAGASGSSVLVERSKNRNW